MDTVPFIFIITHFCITHFDWMTSFLFVRDLLCHVVGFFCIILYTYTLTDMYIRSKLPHTYLLFKNSNVFRGECVSLTGVLSPRPDALESSAAWRRVVLGTKRFFRTGAPFRILPYTSSVCSDAHHPSRREAKIHHFLLLLCHLPLWYTDLLLDGATRSWDHGCAWLLDYNLRSVSCQVLSSCFY